MTAASTDVKAIDESAMDVDTSLKVIDTSKDAEFSPDKEIGMNIFLLKRYAVTLEQRFMTRVLRNIKKLRHSLNETFLLKSINSYFSPLQLNKTMFIRAFYEQLQKKLESNLTAPTMEVDSVEESNANLASGKLTLKASDTTEDSFRCIDMYFAYLYLLVLLDKQSYADGQILAGAYVDTLQNLNMRAVDALSSRIYSLYSRFYEKADVGKDKKSDLYGSIRGTLLHAYRLATVRNDTVCQAELITLILRNYLHYQLVDVAEKFVEKINFPEGADNGHLARYMYYLGRISAVQLSYAASSKYLQQAIRKAPSTAVGFQQQANKLAVIVQLLMGEVPEKRLFSQKILQKALLPYFTLSRAVRQGDLALFQQALTENAATFQRDKTWTLVLRLRHNVIKAGVRLISSVYAKISFADICDKLQLSSAQDAEYIAAKTISDGVIVAHIDAQLGALVSHSQGDIYATEEPRLAYQQRISFCMALYDEALKAMRYPDQVLSNGKDARSRDWKSSRRSQLTDFDSKKKDDFDKGNNNNDGGGEGDLDDLLDDLGDMDDFDF